MQCSGELKCLGQWSSSWAVVWKDMFYFVLQKYSGVEFSPVCSGHRAGQLRGRTPCCGGNRAGVQERRIDIKAVRWSGARQCKASWQCNAVQGSVASTMQQCDAKGGV